MGNVSKITLNLSIPSDASDFESLKYLVNNIFDQIAKNLDLQSEKTKLKSLKKVNLARYFNLILRVLYVFHILLQLDHNSEIVCAYLVENVAWSKCVFPFLEELSVAIAIAIVVLYNRNLEGLLLALIVTTSHILILRIFDSYLYCLHGTRFRLTPYSEKMKIIATTTWMFGCLSGYYFLYRENKISLTILLLSVLCLVFLGCLAHKDVLHQQRIVEYGDEDDHLIMIVLKILYASAHCCARFIAILMPYFSTCDVATRIYYNNPELAHDLSASSISSFGALSNIINIILYISWRFANVPFEHVYTVSIADVESTTTSIIGTCEVCV